MRKKLLVVFCLAAAVTFVALKAIPAADKNKNELFKQVQLFADTLAIVQTEYVDQTKPKDLIYGALKGMISSLDPHSQFLDPDTYNELKVDTEGKFGGLGIEITIKDSLLTVVTPIEDTPAWKAGIKAKDRIVKINNELTRDMSLTDAVKKLRGKPGEAVHLTVLRESEKKLLEFKIVRDIIRIQDIKNPRVLEDGIAYIRLVEFRENTNTELDAALNRLAKEGMTALIIDLRNNPGGLLDSAVGVASHFIDKGKLIVSTKGRKENQNMEFFAEEKKPLKDLPLVIMINEGSASGSEIVAGCLQDYKRAIIVGAKSFGKGSVQTIIPLGDGSALRLTTSKYFTPSGKLIHGVGVMPDITVENGVSQIEEDEEDTEATAARVFDAIEQKDKKISKPADPLEWRNDTQLVRAVDVLKALKIYRQLDVK